MCNLQLAYLPYKRRDLILDDENIDPYVSLEGNTESVDETLKEKKTRKHGLLNWLKLRVCIAKSFYACFT
jgi:centromeric protein E